MKVGWLAAAVALVANLHGALALELRQNLRTFPNRDTTFWPLCGRIDTNQAAFAPYTWNGTACPASRRGASYHDGPIRSTFGPRPLKSDGERFDWHRGIDLSTPNGTAVFAIASGTVVKVGVDASYSEEVVILRHYRDEGQSTCDGGNCFHSVYLHMSDNCCTGLSVDDEVEAGDFLGFSGESASGYEHLHFEIRDAPPDDKYSYWQRDCIHPLHALPYSCDRTTGDSGVDITEFSDSVVNVTAHFDECENVVRVSLHVCSLTHRKAFTVHFTVAQNQQPRPGVPIGHWVKGRHCAISAKRRWNHDCCSSKFARRCWIPREPERNRLRLCDVLLHAQRLEFCQLGGIWG